MKKGFIMAGIIIMMMSIAGCGSTSTEAETETESATSNEYYNNTPQEDLFTPFDGGHLSGASNALQEELDDVTGGVTGTDKLENNGEVFETEEIEESEMDTSDYSITLTGANEITANSSEVSEELINNLAVSPQMLDSILKMLKLMSNEFGVSMDTWRVYESDEVSSSMQYEMYHFTDGTNVYTVLASFGNDEYLIRVGGVQ